MNAKVSEVHKNNVSKTAIDALIAKHSAVCVSGYPVSPGSPKQDQLFRDLLSSMAQMALNRPSPLGVGSFNRTQTPLVNLGYAMRVSMILRTIETFANYHRDLSGIQLVLLGAGLDVSGVWSASLSPVSSVLELDTAQICQLKAKALLRLDGIHVARKDRSSRTGSMEELVFSAAVGQHGQEHDCNSTNYALFEVDLRDASRVQRLLSEQLDHEQPTLIISELVLAYLSESQVDGLLRQLAELVHQIRDSALIAWEPLGPSFNRSGGNNRVETVLQGFHRKYFGHYEAKLERGTAAKEGVRHQAAASFHPLGCSTLAVEERLTGLGFAHVHACVAGTAVMNTPPLDYTWTARELFDEHAALALHLRSYVCVCAFGDLSSWMIRQSLCPWLAPGCPLSRKRQLRAGQGTFVWLASVEPQDEHAVRNLYTETYRDLAETHRSIRTMVKTALRTDLQESRPPADVAGVPPSTTPMDPRLSSIYLHYKSRGGLFLVAVIEDPGPKPKRQVVGAIGMRRLGRQEVSALSTVLESVFDPAWEVHRLMVDSQWRGRGIGSHLLERAEELLLWRTISSGSLQLLAVTPASLASANAFYASHGFSLKREASQGELRMHTYCKTVSRKDEAAQTLLGSCTRRVL